jgi:hypothetical protein
MVPKDIRMIFSISVYKYLWGRTKLRQRYIFYL